MASASSTVALASNFWRLGLQGGPKIVGHRLMTIILSNLNRFKTNFTRRFLDKFAVKRILNIPSHLAYVARLRCKTLTEAKQAINDELQGSVGTHLRCGGVVITELRKVYCWVREWKRIKIGEYLSKWRARAWLSHALCTPGQHTASSYCKPCLLHGTEAVALNTTRRRSLSHTWQYVVSKVFRTQVTMSALFVMWLKLCPSVNSWYIEMLLSWRTYRNSTVSSWLLATWLGTVAKMNCMNYLTLCDFRL